MKIMTTARHYELTPNLKEYAEAKIENLTTFFDRIVSAHIIFALEKYRHTVEVTLHVNGKDLVAHEESEDMYVSVDKVAEKLERQVLRYKGKRERKKSPKLGELDIELSLDEDEAANPGGNSTGPMSIIPADPIEFPLCTVEEAIERLRDNDKEFSIFSNRATKRINVLYQREDGTLGIIEA